MPKKKKYPRLPNGFGSIRYLGKGRSLPYAVHPPATERTETGSYILPKAICYVPDWYTGFGVLSAYHAGTYTPGLELKIAGEVTESSANLDQFCRRLLQAHSAYVGSSTAPTFAEVYEQFIDWKFGNHAAKDLAKSTKGGYEHGFKLLSSVHNKPLDIITLDELQAIVNNCDKTMSTRKNILQTAKNVYKYALPRHLCPEDTAAALILPSGNECEKGVPFSDDDLKTFWKHVDDPDVEILLIMCHAGYRINAWRTIQIDMDALTFTGGNKTTAGKNLVTPIHKDIISLVQRRIGRDGELIGNVRIFRENMTATCNRYGMERHTPHDTKHTFSRLCEKYGVRENDRKRMLGHTIGNISSDVYGHRDIEDLRNEINKICDKL